jgi:hypothetical protein
MKNFTRAMRASILAPALLTLTTPVVAADEYGLDFRLRLRSDTPRAAVAIEVKQKRALLREARFSAPRDRYSRFRGDGDIDRDGDYVIWKPPAKGGTLEFRANLENQRDSGSFDSLVTQKWALFRADDVFPPARVRHRAGARSRSRMSVTTPDGWSVITPFETGPGGNFIIDNPDRAFDRPTGWMIAGQLGRRKDIINGMEVSVAAPVSSGVERIGMLALLRWTLPHLAREMGPLPPRISIVSAGGPMWRGGLSAGNSVYVHAERPLLSENATSTLLHEVLHVLLPVPTKREHDWIDEGIAEYVTLRLLRDGGTISQERFQKAIDEFEERGRKARGLVTAHATGDVKAKAVAIFARLDAELLSLSDGEIDIYDLVRSVQETGAALDTGMLRDAALALTGAGGIEALAFEDTPAPITQSNLTK